jgi:hypothetical protein
LNEVSSKLTWKEHARAKTKGYPTPIWCIQRGYCDANYDATVDYMIDHLYGGNLGTITVESTYNLIEHMVV